MPEAYIGELRMFPFGFAPTGWAQCNGQLLSITQNQALFSILGTTYGGDGRSTFALPNLTGRVPVHVGNGVTQGQMAGEPTHALTIPELPVHTHAAMASNAAADQVSPAGNVWASVSGGYSSQANTAMSVAVVQSTGSGLGHNNMQPYGVVNICIATVGIYPTRNG